MSAFLHLFLHFFICASRCLLDVGGVFELNNQAKHYVSNWGTTPRVHLIFDYLDADDATPPLEVGGSGQEG